MSLVYSTYHSVRQHTTYILYANTMLILCLVDIEDKYLFQQIPYAVR